MKKLFLVFVLVLFIAQFSQAQWEPDVRLTNASDTSRTSYNGSWCVASSGDTVHVVWYDKRDANWEIFYKRSTDGGLTWGADTRLTNDLAMSSYPSIALSGPMVHIVWKDTRDGHSELYYKRSVDRGESWGNDIRLTNTPSYHVNLISVSSNGLWVHVLWALNESPLGSSVIYYKNSADGGLTWEPETLLASGSAYFPSVASSGADVYVVWTDQRDGNFEIYFNHSADGGFSWSEETRLTDNLSVSFMPSISISGSVVHVVWYDRRDYGLPEVYYKRSLDGGISWEEDTRLTFSESSASYFSNLTASGQVVHVVWEDNREGNFQIYYKRSDDVGENWGEETQLSENLGWSSNRPSVAVSGPAVHVVWYDSRDGNYEIYYKRNPTGNIIVGIENDFAENTEQSFTIYPNPASSIIHIQFNDNPTGKSMLTIRNILGEILITSPIEKDKATVDVSTLPNGIYFMEIAMPNKQPECRKLIIRK